MRPGHVGHWLQLAFDHISDPHVLVLALLFHDLGKAESEVHIEEGTRLAKVICERMGIDGRDGERIIFLVQHHMLMSNIAMYRDVDDEDVIQSFAETVQNVDRLRLLFVLTYADMKAVGPSVWNDWKGALLLKLYLKTERRLRGGGEDNEDEYWKHPKSAEVQDLLSGELKNQWPEYVRAMGDRYFWSFRPGELALHLECMEAARTTGLAVRTSIDPTTNITEVVICTPDRPGRFAELAGCFTSQLIDVQSASAFTHPEGLVLDCFIVCDPKTNRPLTRQQAARLEVALAKVVLEGESVASLVAHSRKRLFALLQPVLPIPTRISFENDVSRRATVIDIETGDRTGLLFDVAHALAEMDMDIISARIVTDARRVRDAFYVTRNGKKLEDKTDEGLIEQELLRAIRSTPTPKKKGESQ